MTSTVALIMKMNSAALFEGLARCMPVWIAETETNRPLKEILVAERNLISTTWFPLRSDEKLETAAVRISFSLDDHFNENVQLIGYKTLLVFGASYLPFMMSEYMTLGFTKLETSAFGFLAVK
jgi:hypothetical protein